MCQAEHKMFMFSRWLWQFHSFIPLPLVRAPARCRRDVYNSTADVSRSYRSSLSRTDCRVFKTTPPRHTHPHRFVSELTAGVSHFPVPVVVSHRHPSNMQPVPPPTRHRTGRAVEATLTGETPAAATRVTAAMMKTTTMTGVETTAGTGVDRARASPVRCLHLLLWWLLHARRWRRRWRRGLRLLGRLR